MAIEAEALQAPDVHPFEDIQFWETKRQITHAEARESATRLINSHFRNEDRARVSIPANPDRDDDLIIQSYIRQQARAARDGSLIHRSALAEDTARAEEGWPSIDSAPQNGAPVWGICMEAQTPKPKITWWANGWHTVSAAEKFVPAGPHKWWPTHWAPLAAPTRLPLKEAADANR